MEQQQLHLMFLCQLDQRRKPHRAAEVHVQIGFRNATNEVGCDRALRVGAPKKTSSQTTLGALPNLYHVRQFRFDYFRPSR
jgi:hypothetical protein